MQVEDLPNRLYDMVVVFWQCAAEGWFFGVAPSLSGVATLDVYWATTKFEAHSCREVRTLCQRWSLVTAPNSTP